MMSKDRYDVCAFMEQLGDVECVEVAGSFVGSDRAFADILTIYVKFIEAVRAGFYQSAVRFV